MGKVLFGFGLGLVLIFLFAILQTLVVKLTWAYSIEPLFGIRQPGWVEAYALVILCGCLFKSSSISKK